MAFGGRVEDLETILIEERLPEGWESRILEEYGMTIITFNFTIAAVEKGIDEAKYIAEKAAAAAAAAPATSSTANDASGAAPVAAPSTSE